MIDLDEPIHTERLTLRAFKPADVDGVLASYGNPDVVRYLYSGVLDRDRVVEVVDERARRRRIVTEGDTLQVAVEHRVTGAYVGELILRLASRQHRQAEIGFVIGPGHQGRGYAREGTAALITLAVDHLGVHRIFGRADARNVASMAAMRSLGMRQEAHLRQNEYVKGEWCDEVIFAVLAPEWRAAPGGVRTLGP
jgi:RimJ/RimL family protein N-acetyltransferase